jgi:hypothetical protein
MIDKYSFELWFEDLDEDLVGRKIKEMAAYDISVNNYEKEEIYDGETGELTEKYKDEARERMEIHFPIYF